MSLAFIGSCDRCHAPVRVQAPSRSSAQMLKRVRVPRGLCANCAVTAWLRNTYPCNMLLHESLHGPTMLLLPHIQEQFVAIMRSGHADMRPEEIDWETVVRQWDLPVTVKRTAMNQWVLTDQRRRTITVDEHAEIDAQITADLRELGWHVLSETDRDVILIADGTNAIVTQGLEQLALRLIDSSIAQRAQDEEHPDVAGR